MKTAQETHLLLSLRFEFFVVNYIFRFSNPHGKIRRDCRSAAVISHVLSDDIYKLQFYFSPTADHQKTDEQREREVELMKQLVSVVNKRDQLVQFEDSQLQQ